MEQRAKKKAYEAPKLVRYGDLVEVTRTIAGTKNNDHGHGDVKTV